VQVHVKQEGDIHQVRVSGALTFVGVPQLSTALAQVPVGAQVELDLSVEALDHSGYEALESWCQTHRKTGGKVWMEPLEDVWTRRGSSASAEVPEAPERAPGAAPAASVAVPVPPPSPSKSLSTEGVR
jgi:carbonic anhydrase